LSEVSRLCAAFLVRLVVDAGAGVGVGVGVDVLLPTVLATGLLHALHQD
jgi:hypothetical protein